MKKAWRKIRTAGYMTLVQPNGNFTVTHYNKTHILKTEHLERNKRKETHHMQGTPPKIHIMGIEFIPTRPTLQEMLKEFFKKKRKDTN